MILRIGNFNNYVIIQHMYGDTTNSTISAYQPNDEVLAFTAQCKKDYGEGERILNKSWRELNNRSVIQDTERGNLMFNAFVDEDIEDPNEAWKWRGTRSIARNKGIAMHANLTANYLLPVFLAQNEDDDIDRDFSEIMRDIIEWMALPNNSNYQSSFLSVVFGMIQNPVTYLGAEYCEVFQTIKEKQQNGEYTKKEILDEVLSGFQAPVYSPLEVLITNAHERNTQRQRVIIKRRYCERSELEAKYGEHVNFGYVQNGIKSIYNSDEGIFYDVKDDDHPNLVVEETVLNRRDDSEVCFVNGIYMGNENIENNPIKHRDNRGAPKYNVIPFVYHRIGEHFFYGKSMMNALSWDNDMYDAMTEVVMNRAFLETEMPIAVSGSDKIDSDVIFPNSVVSFKNENVKIQPLLPNSNMSAGFNVLRETEKSLNDSSLNETISGQNPASGTTAYSISQAQAASKKLISGIGKSLAESMVQYGDLMKDIAINHITVPQVEELIGGGMKLRYRTFLLNNKDMGGRKLDKRIKFDESLIGLELTDDEKMDRSMKLLEESGYPDNKEAVIYANPELFAKFKYLSKVDIEEMFVKNQEYYQPLILSLKQALVNDPYANQEALTRELMYAYFQSRGENFIQKQPIAPVQGMEGSDALSKQVQGRANSSVASAVAP